MTVLAAVDVAGAPDAWAAAGFAVDADGTIRAGHCALRTGKGERGIAAWHLADASDVTPATHPNTTALIDHLVVFTDDSERTTAEYARRGLDARRVREMGNGATQTFFRAGEVIIELVGPVPEVPGERPWGLAFTVADLDACAALLGDVLGAPKDAVQPGRRIATLRHHELGLTVPVAFMSLAPR
jgi:hypothetical protein